MKMMKYSRVAAFAAALAMWGCSSVMQTSASYDDGMYGVHDKMLIAERQRQDAELRKAEAEARRAELEARRAEAQTRMLEDDYYGYSGTGYTYSSVLADTYESAYMRRLAGFSSPTYRMPSSYYNLRYGGAFNYVTAYDPAFYNIMVSGNQVWVEPKYISSMFGTWGAVNVTLGMSAYPYSWYYGWGAPYYYGAWWGYPRYSPWYGWGWGAGYYDPWWGYGYGWHYGRGPAYGYRPPYTHAPSRPSYRPPRPNIVNRPMYSSPSSGKGYGSRTSQGTVSGSGTYRPGSSSGTYRPGSGTGSGTGSGSSARPGSSSSSGNRTRPGSSGSGSYNSGRGGSSSFFNGSRSGSSGSGFSGSSGSSSGGSRGGGNSGSSSGRGNSLGR